jgi:hypothetical protein
VSLETKLPESVQCQGQAAFAWLDKHSDMREAGIFSVMTAFTVKKYGCFVHELVD